MIWRMFGSKGATVRGRVDDIKRAAAAVQARGDYPTLKAVAREMGVLSGYALSQTLKALIEQGEITVTVTRPKGKGKKPP